MVYREEGVSWFSLIDKLSVERGLKIIAIGFLALLFFQARKIITQMEEEKFFGFLVSSLLREGRC